MFEFIECLEIHHLLDFLTEKLESNNSFAIDLD